MVQINNKEVMNDLNNLLRVIIFEGQPDSDGSIVNWRQKVTDRKSCPNLHHRNVDRLTGRTLTLEDK